MKKPTEELYRSLQVAYAHFNQSLFDQALPEVIFTVQRQRGMLGYFAAERWSSMDGNRCHEIAINPAHMGESRLIEVLQTLVHEMVHCWQHCLGSPGNGCYHNKEWAHKMIEVGLQPTSTGLPGGAITGQQMSDYPIDDGAFMKASIHLVNNQAFNIPWIDRRSTPKTEILENAAAHIPEYHENENTDEQPISDEPIHQLLTMNYAELMPEDTFVPVPQKVRAKNSYQCPGCFTKVWGKPNLNLICGDCNEDFEML